MSIVTNGWGGSAISVFGWGAVYTEEYISLIMAQYMVSGAYSCITERSYLRLRDRDGLLISVRTVPELLSDRLRGHVASRTYSGLSDRDYIRDLLVNRPRTVVQTRAADEVGLRIKDGTPNDRTTQQLLSRDKSDVDSRSEGWPEESGELCE